MGWNIDSGLNFYGILKRMGVRGAGCCSADLTELILLVKCVWAKED